MYFCEAQLCQPQNQYIQNQDLQVAPIRLCHTDAQVQMSQTK